MAHPLTASERMPSEDALFLYLEKPEMPLHIGSVSTFDGPLSVARLKSHVVSRLGLIPRYQQRVVFPPLHLGHPTWEFDADFDINGHVRAVRLKPGTDAALYELAGELFGQIMDRNRPLWDLTIVNGLEGGRSALIARVHHCLVDGVAGVGIMNTLLSTANRRGRQPLPPPVEPAPAQDATGVFLNAVLNSYSEVVGKILTAQSAALTLMQGLLAEPPMASLEQLARLLPELLKPVERLPFNKPVHGKRKYCATRFSIPEIDAIRGKLGGKVNDVALAIITRAVARYAELHGQSTAGRKVRMMVPVNLRKDPNNPGVGNNVSFIPADFPLDIHDMAPLLATVHETMARLKRTHVAEIVHLAATWLGVTPAPLQAAVGLLGNVLPIPPFNMVCTNVPGPPMALYALGRRMLTYDPYVPIGNEMGLCCAMESYDGGFFFGVSADSGCVPDIERFRDFLDEAYGELRVAAGLKTAANAQKRAKPAARKARARRPVIAEAPAVIPEVKMRTPEPVEPIAAPPPEEPVTVAVKAAAATVA